MSTTRKTLNLPSRIRRRVPHPGGSILVDGESRTSDREAGDTLIEVLIALVVLGITVVAMLLAFGSALTSSAEHRTLTNIALAQRNVSQQIYAQLENANPPLYLSCAALSAYQTGGSNAITFTGLPHGYSATVSGVSYWVSSAFTTNQANCVNNQPQLITATVTSAAGSTSQVTAIVNNPTAPTPPPAGSATQLVFSTEPGGAQSAQTLGPQPVVEIQDSAGHVVTSDLSDVVLTLTSASPPYGPVSATLSSSCIGSENYGVVSFSGCSVATDGTYTLTATDASLPGVSAVSNSFTVSVGPATQMLFSTQPSGTATGGTAFTVQPQLTLKDAGGNVALNDSSTATLAITSGTPTTGGPGAVSGCSQTETNGVIKFSGCSINTKGTNYTLTATDVDGSNILTTTSTTITVTTGAPAKLAFTVSPGSQSNGTLFPTAQQPSVAVEDAGGNIVTTGTGSTDTIALAINSGSGTLACTGGQSKAAVGGIATFSGCKISLGTQGLFSLKANDSTAPRTGLTTGISTSFTVAGTATQLVFTTSPGAQTGSVIFPTQSQPVVQVEDSLGDLVTSSNAAVVLAIKTGTGTLTCTGNPPNGLTFAANAGVATATGCKIALGTQGSFTLAATSAGLTAAQTPAFTVAGTAAKLGFTTAGQPANSTGGITGGIPFGTQPVVQILDSSGDVVTNNTSPVKLAITSGTGAAGAALSCASNTVNAVGGVSTFSGCSINLASTTNYTLTATDTSLAGVSAVSTPFAVAVGPAYMLAFSTEPGGGANGAALATQPVVSVEDAGGNLISSATNAVSLTIASQPTSGASIACTTNPVMATAGSASFSGCDIVGTIGSYSLAASSPGLVTATSAPPLTLTVGAAAQLAFSTQPNGGANTAVWTTQPAVTVQDSGGNKVTGSTAGITLGLSQTNGGALGCTTNPKTPTNGVATFAGCEITGTAGTYSLSASATGLTTATSSTFNITFGTATQLVFSTQPGGGTDGAVWATQPVVNVEDVSGNLVTTNTSSITLSIHSQPATGATLTCTGTGTNGLTFTATGGVASAAGCEITGKVGTTYTLGAAGGGLTGTSAAFSITVGQATQLGFSTQPGGGVDGAAWTTQPVVSIEDAGGNPVTDATNSITLAIGTNPGGTLNCTGGSTLAATNGVATFAGCEITGKIGTTYTLTAAATGFTTATSNAFSITIGGATQLAFSTQPGGGANGAVWTAQPAVSIEDVGGNTVTTATGSITLAVGTNPGGALSCASANPLSTTAGTAAFAGCKITGKVGTTYTLTAAATGFTTVTSNAFSITFGAASQLVFTTQPGGGVDGAVWGTQPKATVEDQSGNVVTNSAAAVTFAIGTQPGTGATLACTGTGTNGDTFTANAGVASATGCKITGTVGTTYTLTASATNLTGATSSAFSITIGGATQLAFSTQPGGGVDGAVWIAQPAVTIEDVGGNTVTTANNAVTLAIGTNPGGTLTCTGTGTNGLTFTANAGVATATGCKITGKVGTTYTLTAAANGFTTVTSNAFSITFGAASQLVFSTQPGGGASGATWTTQPSVSIEDVGGNTVTTANNAVTFAIGTNPGGGALTCTGTGTGGLTFNANAGVATATGCEITGKVGTTYTLTAAATGFTTVTSNAFSITFGAASQLVFTTQPGGGVDGAVWGTQPKATVEDQSGNVVTNSAAAVTFAIGTQPGTGATLACTGTGTNGDTFTANAGVASATGCEITGKIGTTYTLTAAATGFTTVTSSAFSITIGGATQLAFSTQPGGGANGAAWGTQPKVTVEDVGGNTVTTANNAVTLAIGTNPGGTLACTGNPPNGLTFAANAGVATATGCKITGKVGTTYTLTAAANGFTTVTSNAFSITFGAASQLVFTTQPGGGPNGATWSTQPAVTVEDASGNVVTNSAASITLAIGTNPGGGTLACAGGNTLAVINGAANFAGCEITGKVGTTYTLTAAATGFTTVTSNAFSITFGAASQLVFTTQPGGGVDGAVWGTQPKATVEDQSGNVVTNSAAAVTFAIGTQPGTGATLACTGTGTNGDTFTANAGVASATGCEITGKIGTTYTLTAAATGFTTVTSSAFSITIGGATQLAFSTQPGGGVDGAAWGTQPKVTVEDVGGNTVTNATNAVTLGIATQPGTGATLVCTGTGTNGLTFAANAGVATATGCKITGTIGSYTLNATATGLNGGSSLPLSITIGGATQLVFSTQPGGGASGATWTTQPSVSIEDVGGNTVTTANNAVTFAIGTNPGGGALTCTGTGTGGLTFNANAGVATATGCEITGKVGTTYTLTAAATGFTTVTSNAFSITFGAASQLVFTTQPGGGVDGAVWGTQPKATVEDQSGNVVTNSAAAVTFAIGTQPGTGATLACTGTGTNGDTFTANAGVASATGCEITGKIGTTYTLTAAATGFTTVTSSAFSITIGGATQLAFSTQPGGGANGAVWGTQPKVTVEDVGGNTVTTANNAVTLAIGTNPGGTLACTGNPPNGLTFAANAGVATATGCKITGKVGTTYTLTAAANGFTTVTSNAFSITFGAASQLVFTTQPGGGPNGATWSTQPAVTVEDASGNVVTNSAASITLAIGTNPGGGTLACAGGNTLAVINGAANFAGCEITGKVGTTYTLTAAATGFTTVTSNAFSITFGAASQLVFTTQPGGGVDGAVWGTQPKATVEDQSGNVVTNSAAAVTFAIGTQPGTGATLACTGTGTNGDTFTANAGVASATGCEITGKIGTTYTLTAAATGFTTVTSSAFSITIGGATQLAFSTQPGGGVDGAAWGTQPKVTVEDVGGNTVTNATNAVTLGIATQPGTGATLVCTGTGTNGLTFAANAGVATATGCKITGTIGSYTLNATATGLNGGSSLPLSITIGGATQLVFSTQPGGGASGATWTTQPSVSIEDVGGNPAGAGTNSITLAINTQPGTGAALTCTGTGTGGDTFAANAGVATAAGCKITNGTTAGAYTIKATATGLATGDSGSFIVYGAASQLAFTLEPGAGTNGTVWGTQPVVSVEDTSGDVVANSAASITLAIATKPNGGGTDTLTCSGTGTGGLTFAAVNGVASISGCEITGRNGTYTITATSNPLTAATSTGFTA